jgi:PAS domain S-box-containing protein
MQERPEGDDPQRLLALLLERTEQGFWFIDNALNTTDANPAMCRMLGLSRQAMLGRNIFSFVDEENAEVFKRRVPRRAQGRAESYEITLLRADGTALHCWNNATPVFDAQGRKTGAVGMFSDIGRLKEGEAALIAAKEEAERANRAKSDFLSRMSHELRTPLNAVLGFAQLLDSDGEDPLSPRQSARVQELLRGGRHLLALINEVLDLSRIEAGALQLQLAPVALGGLIGECLRMVHPMAEERGITLHVAPPQGAAAEPIGAVWADPTRLRQVLLNLLSNAVKYNRAGGEVHLSWRPTAARYDAVRIEVRDSGAGLSAAQQARLFQAFERLEAAGSEIEGAGIGLALSKWLVNLMCGEIGVDSAPGQGSTFWVQLARAPGLADAPVLATAHDAGPPPAAKPPAAAGRAPRPTQTVLYIEDNPVNQLLMEGMLARRPGTRLLTAANGPEGLAMAARSPPDLVLLDIQLPGMDGYEVLKRLRQLEATRGVPAIAVSANAMPADLAHARRAGFDDYVTKPLDLHLLLAALDKALAPVGAPGTG